MNDLLTEEERQQRPHLIFKATVENGELRNATVKEGEDVFPIASEIGTVVTEAALQKFAKQFTEWQKLAARVDKAIDGTPFRRIAFSAFNLSVADLQKEAETGRSAPAKPVRCHG